MKQWMLEGNDIALIGGPDGHSDAVLKQQLGIGLF
jgi:23S rRNA pseudoU1915 N3-methylase RlmH